MKGDFSHNNPRRRLDSIRRAKKEYEKSERGKRIRAYNYEMKSNFLANLKAQVGCEECGIDNSIVLSFHHVNPKEKKFFINSTVATRSWQMLLNEIEKCVVLCANCHLIAHKGLWDWRKTKTSNAAQK